MYSGDDGGILPLATIAGVDLLPLPTGMCYYHFLLPLGLFET